VSYLLDTNVLSETRKSRRNPGVTDWISVTPPDRMYLSVLTIGEIEKGITNLLVRGDQRQATLFENWLADVTEAFGDRILPINAQIAREWGQHNAGRAAPVVDALIAATAKVHGWTMVTRNTKDFAHSGVRLLNPFSD
jgi:predicted nucleic acid-binding protein